MRIGIITLPLDFNYGGILQAFALEEVLRRQGHYVEHIEIERPMLLLPIKTRYIVYIKRFFQKYLLHKKVRVFQEAYLFKTYNQVTQHTSRFIDKYINRRTVRSFNVLKESDYDALIVGSDQVWRAAYTKGKRGYASFLDFAYNWKILRLAYACSFGTDVWEFTTEETKYLNELIRLFDLITVRETTGVELCKTYLHVDAKQVLDPTLLLGKDDYERLIFDTDTVQSPGNLMCYVLDETPDKTEFINLIAKKYSLTPFRSNSKAENRWAPVEERIQPSVEQWLRGFWDSEYVITDSFHACVFSIIFDKPFICLGNKKRGMTRFYSLLKLFGQEFRLSDDFKFDFDKVLAKPSVNYTNLQNLSIETLKTSLNI